MQPSRQQRRALERANRALPAVLIAVPRHEWPEHPDDLLQVWLSRKYMVQAFQEANGMLRLSINRTIHNGDSWVDQITWDELMQIKRECGYGDRDALEVFPADQDIVNVANMRHLWIPADPVPFAWRK